MDLTPIENAAGEAGETSCTMEQETENEISTVPSLLWTPTPLSSNEIASEILSCNALITLVESYPNPLLPSWLDGCWPMDLPLSPGVLAPHNQISDFRSHFPRFPDFSYNNDPGNLTIYQLI